MASQIRSTAAAILLKVRDQLVSITDIPLHRVFLRAEGRRLSKHPVQNDQYLVIVPHAPRPEADPVASAGRVDLRKRRHFSVFCRTRLGTDQLDRDDRFLTREDDGHLALEDAVLDALEIFHPVDDDNNLLTIEPIRSVDPGDAPSTKDEPLDPQWGESRLVFEMRYEQSVNQARQ